MSEIGWVELFVREDVEGLWNGMYKLITDHPAICSLRFAVDRAAVAGQPETNAHLAQELFLELFQNQRFEHYVNQGYTSAEIESELAHVVVPNFIGVLL